MAGPVPIKPLISRFTYGRSLTRPTQLFRNLHLRVNRNQEWRLSGETQMQTLALEITGSNQNGLLPISQPINNNHARHMSVGPNTDLYVEGDRAKTFYKIVDGTIAEYRTLVDGRRQVIAVYYAGDIVGMTAAEHYEYSAEVETDTVVEVISRSQFAKLIETDPQFRSQVMNQFLQRLADSQSHIVLLGRMHAIERVASYLLCLYRRQRSNTDLKSFFVRIPMSRSDIADYLGLTIETVSRSIGKLRRQKVLELSGSQHFRILDKSELERIAGDDRGWDELAA